MEDNRIIELLSEEIRETKNWVRNAERNGERLERIALAAEKNADAAMEQANAAMEEAKSSRIKADAAWELVIMTKTQYEKPIWKRWFGN
ncbi:MAG: hypothetical protein AAF363_18575 [Bacteroidota bacterium]